MKNIPTNTLDIPTGTASGMNNNGPNNLLETAALGVNKDGTIIVGIRGPSKEYSIYWMDGSPPTIIRIERLQDGTHVDALAVNRDGGIAVGNGDTTGGVERAFRWKKDRTPKMEILRTPDGYSMSVARALNKVGNIIVGYSFNARDFTENAIRWSDASNQLEVEVLSSPAGTNHCYARGTDDIGTTIVGECLLPNSYWNAVCWLGGTTTEVTILECLGNRSNAFAHAVSGDGNVIVEISTEPGNQSIGHAVRWKRNPDTNTFNIENLGVSPSTYQPNWWTADAFGVNSDGTVIVGECRYPGTSEGSTWSEAFIWREDATPKVQKLDNVTPGYKLSSANDVTKRDDGTIIAVGYSTPRDGGQVAVRWRNDLSVERLWGGAQESEGA